VLKEKFVKRGVSLKHLDSADPKISGKEYRVAIAIKEGISLLKGKDFDFALQFTNYR